MDFWISLSKDGTGLITTPEPLDIDKMTKYVAENYNDSLEGKVEELKTSLEAKRKACVDVCKESAVELLKKQQEIIKQNEEIISREKETLTELKEKLENVKQKKIELESKLDNMAPSNPEYINIKTDLDTSIGYMANYQDGLNKLTTGPDSIDEHEKEQAEFKRKLMTNKKYLLDLLKKNKIKVQNPEQEYSSENSNNTRDGGNGILRPTVQEAQEEGIIGENTTPIEYQHINSREAARNMLKNFRGSSKQVEMLDGMGYGDIAAMIKHLGPIGRKELRNSLRNRAEELGIDPDDPDALKDIITKIDNISNAMKDYNQMTSFERENFEFDIKQLKYAALLQDASRGFIRRGISNIFSRSDERIKQLRDLFTDYADARSKGNNKRFNVLNSLRVAVGKSEVEANKPKNYRGSRDSRNSLEQRNVPDGR